MPAQRLLEPLQRPWQPLRTAVTQLLPLRFLLRRPLRRPLLLLPPTLRLKPADLRHPRPLHKPLDGPLPITPRPPLDLPMHWRPVGLHAEQLRRLQRLGPWQWRRMQLHASQQARMGQQVRLRRLGGSPHVLARPCGPSPTPASAPHAIANLAARAAFGLHPQAALLLC